MPASIDILRLRSERSFREALIEDARSGLTADPKELSPKYFYDDHGSELFERITQLPEYYPTRTETSILEQHAADLIGATEASEMIELGGGSSRKTELLLDPFLSRGGKRYVSMDVSEGALRGAAERTQAKFPELDFLGVVGDFEKDLAELARRETTAGAGRWIVFLGSTMGNLERSRQVGFLTRVRKLLEGDDRLLLGVDLVKEPARLQAAYDDAQGVTALFNRNALSVLNRELDGDLPLDAFRHRAIYNADFERVEMWLVAERPVQARMQLLELDVAFEAGEAMRTELSCKFRRARLEETLRQAGLTLETWCTDPAEDFALASIRSA